jgi:hypothetical protein
MTALRSSYSIDLHPEDVLNNQRLEIFAVAREYGEDIHPQVVELIESLQGNLGTISSMDSIADNAIFPEVIHEVKAVWDECWKLKALLSDKLDVVEKMVHRFKAEMVSTAELIAVPSAGADDHWETASGASSTEYGDAYSYTTPAALVDKLIYHLSKLMIKAANKIRWHDVVKSLPITDLHQRSIAESEICNLGVLQRAAKHPNRSNHKPKLPCRQRVRSPHRPADEFSDQQRSSRDPGCPSLYRLLDTDEKITRHSFGQMHQVCCRTGGS